MAAGRKQVAFDLDTDALKTYYPSESWNNAYDVIRRHMANHGFNWLQGSVYVSQKPITSAEVTNILDELVSKNPWLNVCMRDCRETNIGREHSKNHVFDKGAEVPTREEIKAKEQETSKLGSMEDYMAEIAKERTTKEKGVPEMPNHNRTAHERSDR